LVSSSRRAAASSTCPHMARLCRQIGKLAACVGGPGAVVGCLFFV
jgi:hypothetical protein